MSHSNFYLVPTLHLRREWMCEPMHISPSFYSYEFVCSYFECVSFLLFFSLYLSFSGLRSPFHSQFSQPPGTRRRRRLTLFLPLPCFLLSHVCCFFTPSGFARVFSQNSVDSYSIFPFSLFSHASFRFCMFSSAIFTYQNEVGLVWDTILPGMSKSWLFFAKLNRNPCTVWKPLLNYTQTYGLRNHFRFSGSQKFESFLVSVSTPFPSFFSLLYYSCSHQWYRNEVGLVWGQLQEHVNGIAYLLLSTAFRL